VSCSARIRDVSTALISGALLLAGSGCIGSSRVVAYRADTSCVAGTATAAAETATPPPVRTTTVEAYTDVRLSTVAASCLVTESP
jgi:hypothetical protein